MHYAKWKQPYSKATYCDSINIEYLCTIKGKSVGRENKSQWVEQVIHYKKPPELFGVMEISVSCCTSGHMTVLVKVHSAPYLNKNNLLHKLHLSKPILFLLCHLLKGNSYLLECGMGKLEHKNLKNLFPVQLGMWFLRKGILRAGITMLKMRISIPN